MAALTLALTVAVTTYVAANRASGADTSRCAEFEAASIARAEQLTGSGERVVVIGDSWSVGLGLPDPVSSWPSRLPGRVHVAGFSGSGFSATASPCGAVSFADRAPAAVHTAELVVVQGGLNDWDRPRAEVRTGFKRLIRALRADDVTRIVVVGPAAAPSRAAEVPRLDKLLSRWSDRPHVRYVSTLDLVLPYRGDQLHLTPAGHVAFGDAVAGRIAALG